MKVLSNPGHGSSNYCIVRNWNKTLKHVQVPTIMHLESHNLTFCSWLMALYTLRFIINMQHKNV